ncbi:NAD(P)H-hydrate dehydratase [Aquitalea sp. LB_tupeE]|uniref:NAD(P)H-hydrate dehydratase n=1 Tax=Aquitalea sp. LB_tupeE TaxID=2748078 RepID=UPI0015BBE396|nr:NAD(P)H-hydrate dehydratase [Aquitalea sp. LB_tupeE]NWK77003.1 NAD(P)H-hydrate dehydratase [Aquitalea sp. LB_tupeE]
MQHSALWSLADLRQLEIAAAQRGIKLMQQAAQATVSWVEQAIARGARILVAAGPGNNGGDALVAALLLMQQGYQVDVLLPQQPVSTEAREALQALRQAGGLPLQQLSTDYPPPALLIDGLFGIGLNRPLDDFWCQLIRQLNRLACPTLALDCPSGLNAYTGQAPSACIKASHTLTFLCHKPGLFYAAGADHAGQVECAPLDYPAEMQPLAAGFLNQQDARMLQRKQDSHKGSHGTVSIVGGCPGMNGAVLLAGRAALAGGAGKVHVLSLDPRLVVDTTSPELMLHAAALPPCLPNCDVLAVGPGLGQSDHAVQWLQQAVDSPQPLVLDADALNLLATDSGLQNRLHLRKAATVITPHPAEAARLLACSTAAIQADRLQAAQQLSMALNAVVVLKGAGSLICAPNRPYYLNTSGGPALAAAGQGDVLTGLIAALLAQGMPALAASCLAVRAHGLAGDQYQQEAGGPIGLTASVTALRCSSILNQLIA